MFLTLTIAVFGVALSGPVNSAGDVLFDGDMLLTPSQYRRHYGPGTAGVFAGSGVTETNLWPKAVIPYHFPWTMSGAEKHIFAAMAEWSAKTCVKFTRRNSAMHRAAGHPHYIVIKDAGGCFSSVGYNRKTSLFSLARNGCIFKRTILHELGHIIGLHHEQARKDRDDFLTVVYKNVSPSEYHNFDKKIDDINDLSIPYDYCSIMHYGPRSFSRTGGFTLLTKDQAFQLRIGVSESVSFSDAKMVNLMYGCNAACATQPSCREPCYVDHLCRCACPPSDACPPAPCRDVRPSTSCASQKRRCFGRDASYDLECAETCGHCEAARKVLAGEESATAAPAGATTTPSTTSGGDDGVGPKCRDDSACKFFHRMNGGSCEGSGAQFLLKNCPRLCGFCDPCGDRGADCAERAKRGECREKPEVMFKECNRSCQLC